MTAHTKIAAATKARFATIEGRVLAHALKPLEFVIERRNTMPILGTVLLAVSGSTLQITGTDLDIQITTNLDLIDAAGNWQICVDARLLGRIARAAGVAEMRIAWVEDRAEITIGDSLRYEIEAILSPDGFPTMPGTRGAEIERFGNGSLAAMLGKVAWCISTEETRYYLNGVAWQRGLSGSRMVATDGHRLALCRYAPEPAERISSVIIPRKTVALVRKFLAGQDVAIHAVVAANQQGDLADDPAKLDLIAGRTTIRTKLIEGTFPDIDRVIPKRHEHQFAVNRQELSAAIDQVTIMTSQLDGRAVRFFPRDGNLAVDVKNHDMGSGSARTATAWPDGAPEFGLNGRYIKELLAHCEGNVIINQIDAGMPFTVTDDDETMTRVIMPMRV